MNVIKKHAGLALLILGVLTVASGCSMTREKLQTSDSEYDYDLIAENLVEVLSSDPRIDYVSTTFQIVKPTTPIGQALFDKLSDKGYGMQLVSGDVGDNFIRYKAESSQTEQGALELYSLAVQNIRVERQYALVDGKTVPISPVTLTTDEPVEIVVDDRLFEIEYDPEISRVVVVDASVPELVLVNRTEGSNEASSFTNSTQPLAPVPLQNVHDIRESNFESVFAQYDDVSDVTLVFPNDSLRLGDRNKTILNSLAGRLNPETDIISIIGCSHGNTTLENGNQLLAEGRAQRVTESLMFAGVDPDLIKDEACWAAGYWDEVAPRRGVLVTHKRLKSEG